MARYADKLLADGERIALRARQHVLAMVIEGARAWAILIAALAIVFLNAFALNSGTQQLVRDLLSWVGLGLLVLGLLWLVLVFVGWYSEDYVITNRRVMKVEGVLKKRSADSSLEKINDAVLEQSVLGRMLGYGDLDILTAAEESVDRYRMLSQVQQFKKTMLDEKYKLEQESFQIPAPPLRAAPVAMPVATVAAAAAPAGPSAQEAAPASREMTSDEITKALGDLASLRDRSAITPEEYEAKKAELLKRL